MKIDRHALITALSRALDFVGVDEVHHGVRVGYMAHEIGAMAGLQINPMELLYIGMLHDCGVSHTKEHKFLVNEFEWDDASKHCNRGADYLANCELLAHYAEIVRHHHTRWNQLKTIEISHTERLSAALIFLADRVDVLQARVWAQNRFHQPILLHRDELVEKISLHTGTLFNPELVKHFAEIASRDAFWFRMDPDYIMQWVDDKAQLAPPITVDLEQAREVAQLFATIVDAKSPYTAEHSHRVAAITKQLGEICGFSGPHLVELEIAALLHDIGKLRVPDELIEYPGELSAAERSMMRRHSFDTHTILSAAFPGSQIAIWASSHHENNDGSGYPNRLLEQDIPTEAQLIHIADYMQALAQKRPYKPALSAREVAEMIRDSVAQSKISPRIYAHVEQSFDQLFSLATGAA